MDHEQIQQLILARLSGGTSPAEITYEICEMAGLNWQEAEALVQQVQVEKRTAIARRQSPLLFLLGAAIFLGGIALLAASAWQLSKTVEALASQQLGTRRFASLIAAILYAPEIFGKVVFGLALVIGSLTGMTRLWYSILFKD